LKIGAVLFLLLAIFFSLVFISRAQKFRIGTIAVSGETLVSADDVVAACRDFLSGYYLGLFPRDNFLIYPGVALQNFLKDKFKLLFGNSNDRSI